MEEGGNGKSYPLRDGLYGMEYREADLRRVPEGEKSGNWDIKQLWQRSHEIISLHVRGFKNVDIAKIVGVTPVTVSNTINSELGKHKIADLREMRDEEAKVVSERIRVLTDKALNTYNEILDNESGEASLKDRKDVADTVALELSGLRAPTKHISATLTADEIEEFKRRAKLAKGALEGEIVEGETEDVP